jgi:hypothetical protein
VKIAAALTIALLATGCALRADTLSAEPGHVIQGTIHSGLVDRT